MASNSNVNYCDSKLISYKELIIENIYQQYKLEKYVPQTRS